MGFVPEPNAGALGGVADEFDAGCFEGGADEAHVSRGNFIDHAFGFYSFNCPYAD